MPIQVKWGFPDLLPPAFTKQRILSANNENGSYNLVKEIDIFEKGSNVPTSNFLDINGNRDRFYIVRFYDPVATVEFDDFNLGFFPPTPREKRLILWLDSWTPEVMKEELTDFDKGQSIRYSLNRYNLVPAFTNFTIDTLPQLDEQFIITGAKVWLIYLKYLKLSIRDFEYSDMGFTLRIDRGKAMKEAIDNLNHLYMEEIKPAKWRFTPQGFGLGSVFLPTSLGAQISRSALNILDIFQALGR